MRILFVVNDPPYGTEKVYNALRLAMTLQKEHENVHIRFFFMADGVLSALAGQETAEGYYNVERMLRAVTRKGGEVALCGSCLDARGLKGATFVDGCSRGSMSQLAMWTVEADNVLTF
ncbi:MAG: DsrE family protein [Rubricoccaceae bacterium]|nr:DsrE family protein [Rubricoccaceae bacterium]